MEFDIMSRKRREGSGGGGGDWDESMPTMLYDPEADMSEEDKIEADPVGQLPIYRV